MKLRKDNCFAVFFFNVLFNDETKETASTSTSSQALGTTLPLHAACSRAGKTGWVGEKRKIG